MDTKKPRMSNYPYMKLLKTIINDLNEDRFEKTINEQEYNRLFNILDSFWDELKNIDEAHGHDRKDMVGY